MKGGENLLKTFSVESEYFVHGAEAVADEEEEEEEEEKVVQNFYNGLDVGNNSSLQHVIMTSESGATVERSYPAEDLDQANYGMLVHAYDGNDLMVRS
jgi:hypothetical protein